MTNVCCICFQEEESVNHLFVGCQIVKEIRWYIHDVIQMRWQQSSAKYKRGDFQMVADCNEHLKWRKLEAITCFIIWRKQCNRISRDENKNSIVLIREIL
jgi:hypothetical protein